MTIPSIEQVIAAIPDWAGRAVTAERIPAGLTNTNWRVVVDGTPFFVRIPGTDTELLAVDRGNGEASERDVTAPAGELLDPCCGKRPRHLTLPSL